MLDSQKALPFTVYEPVGARLSGMLSGVIVPTTARSTAILVRNPVRFCPTCGLPIPLLGMTMVIVPSALKLLAASAGVSAVASTRPYWKTGAVGVAGGTVL